MTKASEMVALAERVASLETALGYIAQWGELIGNVRCAEVARAALAQASSDGE
jgi:hypothetical protein